MARVVKPLVLVAAKDPFQLELLQEACEAAGFEVVAAMDGQRALAQIARHPPSIVLLSDAIEDPSGDEVASVLRGDEELRTLPVVAIGPGVPQSDIHIDRPIRVDRLQSVLWRSLRRARDTRRRLRTESALRLSLDLDAATGAGTRGQMEITLHHELLLAARFRRPLGLLRVRVEAVDAVPKVAHRMMDVLRETDLVFRLSDRELAAILPETQQHEGAVARDRLCASLGADEQIRWVGVASSDGRLDASALLAAALRDGEEHHG